MVLPSPVFIIGFQRSGTTLLRLMLDSHREIAIPLDTTGLWDRYERRLGEYQDLDNPRARRRIVRDLMAEERIRLWEIPLTEDAIFERWRAPGYPGLIDAFYSSYALARGKRLWGDKDPGNMTRLDQLHRWFPAGRVIHIIRDGRDACLSQLKQGFGFDDVLACAASWREEVSWVRRMGALLDERYHELRYEELIADPGNQLKRITGFLGIPFDPSMLHYYDRVQEAVPESKRHLWPLLNQPPQAGNFDRWRSEMRMGTRICFEKRAGTLLEALGYQVSPRPWSGHYLEEARHLARFAWRRLAARLRRGGSGAKR